MRLVVVPTPEGFTTRPIGLDNTAVMMTAQAAGVDTGVLAEILPRIEAAIVSQIDHAEQREGADDDDA